MRFRIWLEQNDDQPTVLRKDEYEQVQKLYDATIKALGINGAPTAAVTTTLKDIQDDTADPDRPPQKGVRLVQNKLQHILSALGHTPHFEDRASDTQQWLQKMAMPSESGKPRPDDNIATLLKKMFGNDALTTYGEKKWKNQVSSEPTKPPQDQPTPSEKSTAPSMADQMQQDNPPSPAGPIPPVASSPAVPGTNNPTMPAMASPPPNVALALPGPEGQIPDEENPEQPLQSPGGPFPKMPPGGLSMS